MVALCSEGKHAAAHLRLLESGLTPTAEPGLWDYIARQSDEAGNRKVAHDIRWDLWEAGFRTSDLALREGRYWVEEGDFALAAFFVREAFGPDPDRPEAREIIALSQVRTDPSAALETLGSLASPAPDFLVSFIDALRSEGALEQAAALAEDARARFPGDDRFVVRLARTRESMSQWSEAAELWSGLVAGDTPFASEAWRKLAFLNHRLERFDDSSAAAARALAEVPAIGDRIQLALSLDQGELVDALLDPVLDRYGGVSLRPSEARRLAERLLDFGRIGQAALLSDRGYRIGPGARQILLDAGIGENGRIPVPATAGEARAMRSPDVFLPLTRSMSVRNRPAGWPGKVGRKPRIFIINATLAAGGAERQLVMLVRTLLSAGLPPDRIDVALLSLVPDRGHDHFLPDLEETGVTIHDAGSIRTDDVVLPERYRKLVTAFPNPLRSDVSALWSLAHRLRPTVLHGWQDRSSVAAAVVGRMLGTEHVVTSARNMRPTRRIDSSAPIIRAILSDLARDGSARLTANAEPAARDYEAWLGLREGRFAVLPNVVDARRFHPGIGRMAPDGPLRITGVFRLAANKRPFLWLETVASLRRDHGIDLRPRIVGVGPFEAEIRAAAEATGLGDLELLTQSNDPAELYGEADMLLLMSRVEGTPNVLLEAQACGLPVAACDVGGVARAMWRGPVGGGLLLPAEIAPDEAATRLADWIPDVRQAPAEGRIRFIGETFSEAALARALLPHYGVSA